MIIHAFGTNEHFFKFTKYDVIFIVDLALKLRVTHLIYKIIFFKFINI
jgi:hypothetical protein